MKRTLTLTTLCILFVAPLATAQITPFPNQVGIYFDEAATQTGIWNPALYQPNQAYLVLTNFTADGTLGWEMKVIFDPGDGGFSSVTGWAPRGSYVNADVPPGFAVGLATPLPGGPAIVLMDVTYFYTGGSCYFFLEPNNQPSIPDQMAALDGADVGNIIPIEPVSGGFDFPVACVNCDVFATEESSWGAIKTLYR